MSKSMPPMDLSRSLSAINKPKPPPSEKVEEKLPTIKTKPIIPSSSNRQTTVNRDIITPNRHTTHVPNSSVAKDPSPPATRITTSIPPKVAHAPVSIYVYLFYEMFKNVIVYSYQ